MSDKKLRLTELRVKTLAAPTISGPTRFEYWDEMVPGLVLRVTRNGARTYAYRYRYNGKSRLQTIGSAPGVTLDLARTSARQLLATATTGADPANDHLSVKTSLDEYKKHIDRKGLRSAHETKRLLDRHMVPAFGAMNLRKVETRDVLKITDKLLNEDKKSTANAVHSAMTGFFNWCKGRTYLASAPTTGLKKPAKLTRRERVLSLDELEKIWLATAVSTDPYNVLVRLLILTAARRSEVAGARWDEFKDGYTTWDIPKNRTKNKRRHVLPLSALARDVLSEWSFAKYDHRSDFLFPSRGNKRQTISGFSKMKARLDKDSGVANWTVHDIRRSSATLLEEFGTRGRVVQKILNHTTGRAGEDDVSPVGNIYMRGQHWQAMREALDQLSGYFSRLETQDSTPHPLSA